MYKKSDFKTDIASKVAIIESKLEIKTIETQEDFNYAVVLVKELISNTVSELGFKKPLNFEVDYTFNPIGIKDAFTSVTLDIKGVTDLKTNKYNRLRITVERNSDITKNIVKALLEYYERVETGYKLEANLAEFNTVIAELMQKNAVEAVKNRLEHQLEEEEVDFDSIVSKTTLEFGLSEDYKGIHGTGVDFLQISELHAVIGLTEDVIMNLGSNAIFDTVLSGRAEASRKEFAKVLNIYVQPYGLVKVNDVRTKDLGIYTREDLHTVMRRSFNTQLAKLERGLGYYETAGSDGIFAIIEKKVIKETDIKEATEDLIYIDNLNMTEEEAKQGLNKIEISFRIFPYSKSTDEPAGETLEQIWKSLNK